MSTEKKSSFLGRLFGRGAVEQEPATALPPDEAAASDAVPVTETSAQPSSALKTDPEAEPPAKKSWLQRLTSGLAKTSSKLTEGITSVFTKKKLDATTLDDLEDLLIQADLGVDTARKITDRIAKSRYEKGISPDEVRRILAAEVEMVLAPVARPLVFDPALKPHVVLVVGVNGSGKTTTIGKLAADLKAQGKKVMLVAGDTFRAAAIEQLSVWGDRVGATVIKRDLGADAAGLAYDALEQARAEGYDVVLMDTAGRLQNKQGLMDELAKIVRVMRKGDEKAPHDVVLVLDATTGQNALNQVEVFRERAGVTGLVMTKLDGTARGGILVAIAAKYQLPVHAIGVGESAADLAAFDAKEFATAIALN